MPPTEEMYRTHPPLKLVRASSSRSVVLRERRAIMKREAHNLAIVATSDGFVMDPAFDWLGDLRRGRRHIWGSLLRFIDSCARRQVPKRIADMLAPFIQSYVDESYSDIPPTPSPTATAKVA